MTPLEKFGARVLRMWFDHDFMEVDGADLEQIALDTGVVFTTPYRIDEHGPGMHDEWDVQEGDLINRIEVGVRKLIEQAHDKEGKADD